MLIFSVIVCAQCKENITMSTLIVNKDKKESSARHYCRGEVITLFSPLFHLTSWPTDLRAFQNTAVARFSQ